jgi:hypothetical protein
MVIVLCPAASWISLMDAPDIASHEQNVCRLQCHSNKDAHTGSMVSVLFVPLEMIEGRS